MCVCVCARAPCSASFKYFELERGFLWSDQIITLSDT